MPVSVRFPLADGVKAGGAQGDRLEGGVEPLLPQGQLSQGSRVVVLLDEEKQGAQHQQGGGNEQDHFAVGGEGPPPPLLCQILPHQKAQAARHHQQGGHAQQEGVVPVARQAAKGPVLAPRQVEPRVAEGGHGVEHGVPDPPQKAVLRDKAHGHEHRPRPLQQEGAHEGVTHHPHHALQVVEVEGGHHHQPLRQADVPAQGQGDQGDHRHKAQAAQLDHGQDDHLPEQGPLHPGVHQGQAGDTGGGGGGK